MKFLRENSNSRLLFTDPFIHGRASFPCCLEIIKSCQVFFKQRRRYWIIHSCLVYFVDSNCCNCARCATYGVVSAVTEYKIRMLFVNALLRFADSIPKKILKNAKLKVNKNRQDFFKIWVKISDAVCNKHFANRWPMNGKYFKVIFKSFHGLSYH